MSGRIRTVKPEWLEDELLALASADARVLSIGLMLLADDYGNGRANAVLLAGHVFPGKLPEVAANALEELRAIRFVTLYEVEGQRYFAIRNWDKHQKVDKPGKPRVPTPPASSAPFSSVPEALANVPETPEKLISSRASEVQVQVGGLGTGPAPAPQVYPQPEGPRDIQALSAAYLRDECFGNMGGIGGGKAASWPEVLAVCAALQRAFGRPVGLRPIGLKDPRLKVILERFADGFSQAELERAISGSKFADYIANNQAHQTLQTILRDPGQVEKFGALTQPAMLVRQQAIEPRDEAREMNRAYDRRQESRFDAQMERDRAIYEAEKAKRAGAVQ